MSDTRFAIDLIALDKTRDGLRAAQKSVAAAMAQIQREADRADKAAGARGGIFEAAGKRAAAVWHTMGPGRIAEDLGKAKEAAGGLFERVGRAAERMHGAMSPLRALLTGGLIVGVGVALERSARNAAELLRQSKTLGMSTQSLQGWRGAAELSGLSADAATQSFKNLNRTLYEARAGMNPLAVAAAHQFGLNLAAAPEEFAKSLADVMKGLGPQSQQRLADIFGVDVELFRQGRTELERLTKAAREHGQLTDEQVTKLDNLETSFHGLTQSLTGTMMAMAADFAPGMTAVMDQMSKWLDTNRPWLEGKVTDGIKAFGDYMKSVNWEKIGENLQTIGDAFLSVGKGVAYINEQLNGPIGKLLTLSFPGMLAAPYTIPKAFGLVPPEASGPVGRATVNDTRNLWQRFAPGFLGGRPAPGGLSSTSFPFTNQMASDDIAIMNRESRGKPNIGWSGLQGSAEYSPGGTDLSQYPLDATGFPIWPGKKGPAGISHAAGLWMIQPGLWHEFAPGLGITDFSAESQWRVRQAIVAKYGNQPWSASGAVLPHMAATASLTPAGVSAGRGMAEIFGTESPVGGSDTATKRMAGRFGRIGGVEAPSVADAMIGRASVIQAQSAAAQEAVTGGNTEHHVLIEMGNMPQGTRTTVPRAVGPATLGLRVHYAMPEVA